MNVRCRLWIEENGRYVMGDGLYELLAAIDELGSINKAAASLSMSYRKAWGKIKESERYLNKKLVETRVGGKRGGGAALTDKARDILKRYSELKRRVLADIEGSFEEGYDV
jgi:Bacterial regulatory helix-turn-helix protein, lysR family.